MARIREYTQQTSVSGEVGGRRATEEDLGYGRQMQGFGETMVNVGVFLKEQEDRRELDAAQEAMSQARIDQIAVQEQRKKNHQAGDMTLAETTRTETSDYFGEMVGQYKSKKAQHYIKTSGAQITASMFNDSIHHQTVQGAKYSANAWHVRSENDAVVAQQYPGTYSQLVESGVSDIRNGVGSYVNIDTADRDKKAHEYRQNLAWNAALGAAKDPVLRAQILGQLFVGDDKQMGGEVAKMTAEGKSPEEIANFMRGARPEANINWSGVDAKKLPPFMQDLSAEGRIQIGNMMQQYQKNDNAIGDRAASAAVKDVGTHVATYGQLPKSYPDPSIIRDPQERMAYQNMIEIVPKINPIMAAPAEKQEAMLKAIEPAFGIGEAYTAKLKQYEFAVSMVDASNKERQKDSVLWAQNHNFGVGLNPIETIDPRKTNEWADALLKRIPQAEAISAQNGTKLAYFEKPEAAGFSAVLNAYTSPTDAKNVLAPVASKLTQEQFSQFAREVIPGSHSKLFAGIIMGKDHKDKVSNGVPADKIMDHVWYGGALIDGLASQKGDDKSAAKRALPEHNNAVEVTLKFMEGATDDMRKAAPAMAEVAMAYVLGKNRYNNVDLSIKSGSVGETELKDALKTIYGAPSPAGNSKVLRPFGMDEAQFIDLVRERVQLPRGDYGLVHHKDGIYQLKVNNMAVEGAYIDLYKPAIGKNLIQRQEATKVDVAPVQKTPEQVKAVKDFKPFSAGDEFKPQWGKAK